METELMGKVEVAARIENGDDVTLVRLGYRKPGNVRAIEVSHALVDTGATYVSIPKHLIEQLGLNKIRERIAKTPTGVVKFGMYSAVRLIVQGRECQVDVAEVADSCPVLIGQIPLEMLDFLVDPVHHCLIGNPDHGGEQMFDMY